MLNFLGIGGAFVSELKNCAAFYKDKNSLILIDCGENIYDEITKNSLLEDVSKLIIIITHFHTDHVGSLGTLLFYCDKLGILDVNIIYPNKESLSNLLILFGVQKCSYKIFSPSEFEFLNIREFKQEHSFMEAYGYLIELSGKNIYYSGDTKIVPNEIVNMFFQGRIDYFYEDIRKDKNDYHISISELNEIIPFNKRKNIYCMHFNNRSELDYVISNGYNVVKCWKESEK